MRSDHEKEYKGEGSDEKLKASKQRETSQVDSLLAGTTLPTKDDILMYIRGSYEILCRDSGDREGVAYSDAFDEQRRAFTFRQIELNRLSRLVSEMHARVDADGRLVPLTDENIEDNHRDNTHQPAQPRQPQNDQLFFDHIFDEQPEENDHDAIEQIIRQQEQEASLVIKRALQSRYKNIPCKDLRLIPITVNPPSPRRGLLTLRRICCAVVAVATAFVSVMIRSLPSYNIRNDDERYIILQQNNLLNDPSSAMQGSTFTIPVEKLLNSIAKVTLPAQPIASQTDIKMHSLSNPAWTTAWTKQSSSGVLLVPSLPLSLLLGSNDLSFDQKCSWRNLHVPSCFSDKLNDQCAFQSEVPPSYCFRGVHDDLIGEVQLAQVINLGQSLARNTSLTNHFDIHYETNRLPSSIIRSLQKLLVHNYQMPPNIRPAAFRIYVTAPSNGDVSYVSKSGAVIQQHPMLRLINRKLYLRWLSAKEHRNKKLWPLSLFRWEKKDMYIADPCRVMADFDASERFQVHTSIYLTEDYTGGAMLFVDNDSSEGLKTIWKLLRRGRKLQRGLAVAGRLGRVIVSSGDNQRCMLPVQQGVRAVVQIWWGCD